MLTRRKINKILNFLICSGVFVIFCFYTVGKEDSSNSNRSAYSNNTKSDTKNVIYDNFEKFKKLLSIKNYEKIKRLEDEIKNDSDRIVVGLGNNGAGVTLVGNSFERGELEYASNGLNVEVSNHLSYNRTLLDNRHSKCKNIYYDLSVLPKASVIIIFHNEVYSVLLRTVYSVLNTAPESLLADVILVDDLSTNKDLGEKLEYYIETRFPKKVKLLRLPER